MFFFLKSVLRFRFIKCKPDLTVHVKKHRFFASLNCTLFVSLESSYSGQGWRGGQKQQQQQQQDPQDGGQATEAQVLQPGRWWHVRRGPSGTKLTVFMRWAVSRVAEPAPPIEIYGNKLGQLVSLDQLFFYWTWVFNDPYLNFPNIFKILNYKIFSFLVFRL